MLSDAFFASPTRFIVFLLSLYLCTILGFQFYEISKSIREGEVVASRVAIGNVMKIEFLKTSTFFASNIETVITTEQGPLLVQGAALLKNNAPLEKQIMKNGSRRICDSTTCWWIVDDGIPRQGQTTHKSTAPS